MVSAEQNKPAYSLTSVDNALRLVALMQERDEIRLSDAAAELGVANSTAHRLLATLVHRGFAVQMRSRAYRRGPALEPHEEHGSRTRLLQVARPHLVRLTAVTRETSHLVVLEGNGTRFVDCVEGPQVLRVGARTGMLLPAHTNSGGKSLLSRLTDSELRGLYPRGLLPGRVKASVTFDALRRELAATRRRGYGINRDESERGVSAVGRHVTDSTGMVAGALVVAVPSARCSRTKLSELAADLCIAGGAVEREL